MLVPSRIRSVVRRLRGSLADVEKNRLFRMEGGLFADGAR